jgi:molecular chaperone GrpE
MEERVDQTASTAGSEAEAGQAAEAAAPQAGPPPAARSAEDVIAELRAEVERLRSEAERNWQQFLHAAADLENYKKQAARQREDAVQRARHALLVVILAVVDTLERALDHAGSDGAAILEGIRMAHRQVLDLLATMGVRPMEARGQPFDPRYHEAVDVVSAEEHGVAPGTVVDEVQRGYLHNGEVLRPARVRVAKV